MISCESCYKIRMKIITSIKQIFALLPKTKFRCIDLTLFRLKRDLRIIE